MNELFSIILLLEIVCFNPTLARPDLLKQQRYEFREYHTSSSYDHISSPENARIDVAPIPVQHDRKLWLQQHQNEVNAFAEMFRQNYNHMIEQYNKKKNMHHHDLTNPFMPVTYELYHVTDDVMWNNYFGKKQRYVDYQTEQMSRQLIQNLEQGLVSPQDLMNPNFFISQAASELNRVHQVQNEPNDQQVSSNFDGTFQQHQVDIFNDQQQQQYHIFSESTHPKTTENTDSILLYNNETGEYEYVTVGAVLDVTSSKEPEGGIVSNSNLQHLSNIQRLPNVKFNKEIINKFSQEAGEIEIHTPMSVETPRLYQVNVSSHKQLETKDDEFYGSTYDQQPIYDLRFVESVLPSARSSMVNVMSLVRNKTNVKNLTTTSKPSTTTRTTTEQPTTESSIMSMLPNKKQSFNFTDIYFKVQAELDRQMKQIFDNASKETHFIGMTSNTDHVKLSYETTVDLTDHAKSRGDQPSNTDDYISEEHVESEQGVGYYSGNNELVVPTITVEAYSTPPHISSTVKQNQVFQNQPWAPLPTTTIKSLNPYYSAPLAPFPDDIFQVPQLPVQTQIEQSELSDMNSETQVVDGSTVIDFNEQHYDGNILENSEFLMPYDMQKYDYVQQRYFDIAGGHHPEGQMYEEQLPPGQSHQNENSQHSDGGLDHNSDIPAYVKGITETPTSVDNKMPMNNWFQRQFSKLKNVF